MVADVTCRAINLETQTERIAFKDDPTVVTRNLANKIQEEILDES